MSDIMGSFGNPINLLEVIIMQRDTILERVRGGEYCTPEVGSKSFVAWVLDDSKILLQGQGDNVFNVSDFIEIFPKETEKKTDNPYMNLHDSLAFIKNWNDTHLPAMNVSVNPADIREGGTWFATGNYETTEPHSVIERLITKSGINKLESLKELQRTLNKMLDEEITNINNQL